MIDLRGISFGPGTTVNYVADVTDSGGVLQVTDGTHAATLAFLDHYSASDFVIQDDGHAGVLIHLKHDPGLLV
jgi:hypothetical protein